MARRSPDPVRRSTMSIQVVAVDADGVHRTRPDRLATEEPMEIRLHGPNEAATAVATTLRTPGHDFELALGFLHAEQLLTDTHELQQIAYCLGEDGEQEYNVVTVRTRSPIVASITERRFVANSSCGLCGKSTLEDLAQQCDSLVDVRLRIDAATVRLLPGLIAQQQSVFDATGGQHAAALAFADGTVRVVREDVGRHNAVDKIIGHALIEHWIPLHDSMMIVSGRLGFELVQKAALAGVSVICAVGAPSSLAIDTAREFGVTVVAFVREDRFNIYTFPERIQL